MRAILRAYSGKKFIYFNAFKNEEAIASSCFILATRVTMVYNQNYTSTSVDENDFEFSFVNSCDQFY